MDLLLMSRTPVTLVMRGSSKKCIHSQVCENKKDIEKLSEDVLQTLTKPENQHFGITLNCDYYKKKSMFDFKSKNNKNKYNGV